MMIQWSTKIQIINVESEYQIKNFGIIKGKILVEQRVHGEYD